MIYGRQRPKPIEPSNSNICTLSLISLWSKENESLHSVGDRETLNKVLSTHDCSDIMTSAIVSRLPKGTSMAFKPNYNLQRSDRDRAAMARTEEKQKKRDEKAAQRKAERTAQVESQPDGEKA